MSAEILDRTFAALADPTRRLLLRALLDSDQTVADLAAPFAMSLTAVSKHIGILIAAGLVSQYREGRDRWCSLNPAALHDAFSWMQGFGFSDEAAEDDLESRLRDLGLFADDD